MRPRELLAARRARIVFDTAGAFRRKTGRVVAVDDISLGLCENETLALVGESGSGKTTLGLGMLGLRSLSSGEVVWRDRALSSLDRDGWRTFRRDVQVVFQDPYGSLNPRHTVARILRRPLELLGAGARSEIRDAVADVLERVGLKPAHLYLDRHPHEFSGGQRQRIAIARALVLKPRILVADEPVSALDASIRAQILELLIALKVHLGLSMLFLSHDLGVVRLIADRVAVMYRSRIVEIGPVADIFTRPRHPYTRLLLAAAPTLRPDSIPEAVKAVIGTREGDHGEWPASGCSFAPRCPIRRQVCSKVPSLEPAGAAHEVACHAAGEDRN